MSRKRKIALVVLLLLLLTVGGLCVHGDLAQWTGSGGNGSSGKAVAKLSSFYNDVKHRDRNRVDWSRANQGMTLADGDKIRTERDAQAKVKFLEGTDLIIDENSLITIHAPKQIDGVGVADIEIEDGRVRASLTRAADGSDRSLKIRNAKGQVTEISTAGSKDGFAELSVVMRPDRSSRIVVNKGAARVTGMGQTLTLDSGETAGADGAGGALTRAAAPPKPPAPVGPAANAQIAVANTSQIPVIDLAWQPVPGAAHYGIEISQDSQFAKITDAGQVPGGESVFHFHPTAAGEYHWRVLTLDSNQVAGPASEARVFRIAIAEPTPPPIPEPTPTPVPSKTPQPKPTLIPPNVLQADLGQPLRVAGTAKRGARQVSVNGKPARLSKDGSYVVEIENLPAGERTIVIESIYEDGTVTYEKKKAVIHPAAK